MAPLLQFVSSAFAYSGWYDNNNGYVDNVGNDGFFWSSTANDSDNAYELNLNSDGNVNPQNNDNRGNGNSVRCAAQ